MVPDHAAVVSLATRPEEGDRVSFMRLMSASLPAIRAAQTPSTE
jgi:hypothetical protein